MRDALRHWYSRTRLTAETCVRGCLEMGVWPSLGRQAHRPRPWPVRLALFLIVLYTAPRHTPSDTTIPFVLNAVLPPTMDVCCSAGRVCCSGCRSNGRRGVCVCVCVCVPLDAGVPFFATTLPFVLPPSVFPTLSTSTPPVFYMCMAPSLVLALCVNCVVACSHDDAVLCSVPRRSLATGCSNLDAFLC